METTKTQEDFKTRLVNERAELNEKIGKLKAFINTGKFFDLSENNRNLLWKQRAVMEIYEETLAARMKELNIV
ncbi:MAG: hypothetical protein LBR26_09935 [Prevotella sp.]|jgi:hypothetical protein|nr:hypothetical protein [Prevotella sp.]